MSSRTVQRELEFLWNDPETANGENLPLPEVDTDAVKAHAITAEQTALMFECFMHEVDIITGDANSCAHRMATSKGQSMYNYHYSTMQHWTRLFSEARLKADANAKPVVPKTWYAVSSLGLKNCEHFIGRTWESMDKGERARFSKLGDCCETIIPNIPEWGHTTCLRTSSTQLMSILRNTGSISLKSSLVLTRTSCVHVQETPASSSRR